MLETSSENSGSLSKVRLRITEARQGFDSALSERVRLYLKIMFFINLAFTVVATILFLSGGALPEVQAHFLLVPAGVTAFNGLTWLLIARTRSFFGSIVTSGLTTVALAASYSYVTSESAANPALSSLFALLVVTIVLVLRSSLVPSPAFSTAIVGTISVGFPVYMAWSAPEIADWGYLVWITVLSSVIVIVTVIGSYTVYGLERRMWAETQLGQYQIERLLGRGGMGEVYLATHALLRRPTAIKLLRNRGAASAQERFRREVQTASGLTHPNTIEIYDYGRTPEGVFYFAMEHVRGATLDAVVHATGSMSPERVIHVMSQTAGSLTEVHERGLVHRDIKPSNIMLCERGGVHDTVKVMDFGLVRVLAIEDEESGSGLFGTPLYLAPEVILETDAASSSADIYALGVTMYFMLSGKTPFAGSDLVELLSDHLATAPPPLVCEDEALSELVMRCLSKEPSERPADARAFAEQLRACRSGEWSDEDAAIWWAEHREVIAAYTAASEASASRGSSGSSQEVR